jgi:large subunit ribosomal protein L17
MRHGKKFNHLSRTSAHRKAMLANMACSLIEHKRIKTTLAKAKALRVYVEPLITKSKNDTTHSRRIVFSYLKQKEAITELFSDIATKIAARTGGYTRILKLGNRLGDNAQMAYIELVDYNEHYTTDKPKRKKVRRAKKKAVEGVAPFIEKPVAEEAAPSEEVQTQDPVVEEAAPSEEVQAEEPVAEEAAPSEAVQAEDPVVEEAAPSEEVQAEEPVAEEAAPSEEVQAEDPVVEEAAPSEEVQAEEPVAEEEKTEEDNPENKDQKGE